MEFRKYMHLERLGTTEVEGITMGDVYVFPKLDGTNASVWLNDDGSIGAGSRNRELSAEKDNAGFYKWVQENEGKFRPFFQENPSWILYGEWLVPHSLKTYRDDAWRDFYIFDVVNMESVDTGGNPGHYIMPQTYGPILERFELTYLAPFAIVKNGTDEKFRQLTEKNIFYIKDGGGIGEGVVLKNYSFVNKYGRQTWAKVITNQFKEKHVLEMGGSEHGGLSEEEKIVNEYITPHLVDKVHAKIVNEENGWNAKLIPRLLNTVFYDFINEEMWDVLKKYKNPKVDFKFLSRLVTQKVKELKPELF